MASKVRLWLTVAAVSPLACGGTTVSTPGDAAPPTGVHTRCGSLHFPERRSACAACLDTSCCAEATACGADAQCAALVECIFACPPGDTGCTSNCVSAHTRGVNAFQAGNACGIGQCGDVCDPASG